MKKYNFKLFKYKVLAIMSFSSIWN